MAFFILLLRILFFIFISSSCCFCFLNFFSLFNSLIIFISIRIINYGNWKLHIIFFIHIYRIFSWNIFKVPPIGLFGSVPSLLSSLINILQLCFNCLLSKSLHKFHRLWNYYFDSAFQFDGSEIPNLQFYIIIPISNIFNFKFNTLTCCVLKRIKIICILK